MMKRSSEVYRKIYPDFEWCIPSVISVLSHPGSTIQRPPHEFCEGNWILKIERKLSSICYSWHKECSAVQPVFPGMVTKLNQHRILISFRSFMENVNGIKSTLLEHTFRICDFDALIFKYCMGKDTEAEKVLLWDYVNQSDSLKIICKFRCLDCTVKLIYVPFSSNQDHGTLKRRHSEEEVTEFVGPKKKNLYPSGVDTLLRHMKDLLTSGEDSDITIKVKDCDIRTHKNILRARSPVFFKMLSHDMLEKKNGIIDIIDCEPKAFQEFLNYLYTGELNNVSKDIMCNLYYIGDKYEVEEIKKICAISMSEHLSVETFCEIYTFAQRYEESAILEAASEFFIKNLKAIIKTDQWVSFLKEHPVTANELHIKAADHCANA